MLCAQSGHRQKSGTCPYRVCSTCGATGHSARECPFKTVGICNSCGDETQQQHDALATRLCVHCQEHGHDEAKCSRPKFRACCRSTLRNARSFECREHKCTHEMQRRDGFKRAQNKTNSRETMDRICAICEACGSSKYPSARSFECPEHTRTKLTPRLALSPKGRKLHTSSDSEQKLSTVPHARTTKPSARRCQNRLAESTVPGVESPPVVPRLGLST